MGVGYLSVCGTVGMREQGWGLSWLAVQQVAFLGGAAHLAGWGLAAAQQGNSTWGSCPPAVLWLWHGDAEHAQWH